MRPSVAGKLERFAVWVGLAAVAAALPLSLAASNALLGLLTIAVLLRLRGRDRERAVAAWREEPAIAALAIYVAAGTLAAAFGIGPAASLHDCAKDLHRLLSLSVFVAALALEPNAPLPAAFAVGFSAAAAVGVGQTLFLREAGGVVTRAHAFIHPVTFGEQMALASLGGLCLIARPADARTRALAAAVTALCALALTLSQTRAAMLALAVGAVVVMLREPRLRRWAAPALALCALGALAAQFLRYGRLAFAPETDFYSHAPRRNRFVLWDSAWRMFQDYPLTGAGPGHYRSLFGFYFPRTLDNQANWGSAHNLYLHQLAERGLIGAAALALLLAALIRGAWRAERERRDAASLWAAAAVPAFLAMNMTETAFQNEQFATLFLLIWAYGTARRRRAEIL